MGISNPSQSTDSARRSGNIDECVLTVKRRTVLAQSIGVMLAGSVARMLLAEPLSPAVIANTRYGRVAGINRDSINIFKGVRYGSDTSDYRFQPPRIPESWDEVRDASEYAYSAPQLNSKELCSEDCLFLNVWTPALRDHRKRPILVYIHGGEYSTGSGSDVLYDGTRLCQRGDVVVVTINHRLNVLGHLYLGEFADAQFKPSGNVALLDIVMALQWVRDHATEFGGDPACVTLFGQSGGGAKIACLMAMPAAQRLFHRAMTMSGQQITVSGPHAATRRAHSFMQSLQLTQDRWQELLNLPTDVLLHAMSTPDPAIEGRGIYFGPVLDNVVLSSHPFYPQAPTISKHIPMIIGNTHDETRYFYGKDNSLLDLTWNELPRRLRDAVFVDIDIDNVVNEYRVYYPQYTPTEVFFAASTAGRSWRGAIIEAELRAQQRAPAFVYQLNYQSPVDNGRWRACHTLDIPLVFNNFDKPGSLTGNSADAQKISLVMTDALLNFARTGSPNHRGMPPWAPYTLPNRNTMIIDVTPRMENDPRKAERELFATVPYIQRGTY